MKILIALSIIAGLLLGVVLIQDKPTEEKDLGVLLLTPEEKNQVRAIRDGGFNGLILIPESKMIYGTTEQLEKEGETIRKITDSWYN